MTSSQPIPGEVRLAASSISNLAGTGTLAILEFKVLATTDTRSAVSIEEARLNDGAIAVTATNGSYTYFDGYNVTGTVSFWGNPSRPLQANLTLDDDVQAVSDVGTGQYLHPSVKVGKHTMTVRKDDGDTSAIRALDASLILSHVVGSQPLSGYALMAGDVNGNGAVTEQDAAKVLEVVAGLRGLPFINQDSL